MGGLLGGGSLGLELAWLEGSAVDGGTIAIFGDGLISIT
jgi:hypothetical protein